MNLILVSNRLPVRIASGPNGPLVEPSDGGLATAVGRAALRLKPKWVGSLGPEAHSDDIPTMTRHNYYPVSLDRDTYKRYYAGYSNRVLWPILHGFRAPLRAGTYWGQYVRANLAFAEEVAKLAGSEDIIWVHDYQLFIVPELLRAMGLRNKIGFFLHTPFAPSKYFRSTPAGRRILRSLQQCDSVGVQTSRVLRNLRSVLPGVRAGVFPIGIDYPQFARGLTAEPHFMEKLPMAERVPLVLSLSRLDYTKGLPQLLAATKLLAQGPLLAGRIRLRLIVIPSREQQPEYQKLKARIEQAVDEVNSMSSDSLPLVEYTYGFLSPDDCVAAYRSADIFVAAPLADGMNLVAKEYVAANPSGVLVLGRAAGASERLSDALLVDGHSPESIARGISRAILSPPDRDQKRRLRRIVRTENVHNWANRFLRTLQA